MILIIIGFLFVIISGVANGLKETITHHWTAFAAKFPKANKKYWKPLPDCPVEDFPGSWVNKYVDYPRDKRPRFPGALTWRVWTTDAYHLFGEIHRDLLIIGVMLVTFGALIVGLNWALFVIPIAVWLVQSIGFHIVYTFYF